MPAPRSSCRHPSWLWPAAALLGVLSLATGPAAAAQALLRAVPYRYDVEARPGWLETRPLYLQNAGRERLKVRLRLADFRMSDRGALDLLPPGTLPSSLSGLLEFAPRELTLAPGQRRVVRLEMMSPTHGPASRCGLILSEVSAADADGSAGPSAPAALGTTLFLTRAPRSGIRAELVGLDARVDADGKVAIDVRVRNRCDRHASCSGEVKLLDSGGAVAITGVLTDGVVLPGAARVLAWASLRALPAGRYLATVAINVGVPEFMIGEKEVVVRRRGPHAASSPR